MKLFDLIYATLRLKYYTSPVRWVRRKSSSSESERNCYNVQTSQVTTERTTNKKDKKKIQDKRRRVCEKRNPLLDRVKSTRLSFFKDRDSDEEDDNEHENEEDENDEAERVQFRSMCELRHRGLIRNELRQSICESDLMQEDITEESKKNHARRKRRAKSQSRLPYKKHQEERFSFLGFRTSTPRKTRPSEWSKEDSVHQEDAMPYDYRWERGSKYFLQESRSLDHQRAGNHTEMTPQAADTILKKDARFDSITPSSCLAAKFRAMQDRYLKSSTSRLIAKIYRKDCKDQRERRRLRSFSYGTLPGLEELRTNPLYENHLDQDDNDSGILDNDSATSSLLDDRCSSGASGPLNGSGSHHNDSYLGSPPQLPPRRPFSTAVVDVDRAARLFSSLDMYHDEVKDLVTETSLIDEYSSICQAANGTLIDQRQVSAQVSVEKDKTDQIRKGRNADENSRRKRSGIGLQAIKSKTCVTETMVVKLLKETSDQCLGIFIAKTAESNPGYLVAHVVPNGLADKEGTLRIGDEILIVNGKRLRGLCMAEARRILGNGSGPGDVDIVVSRFSDVDQRARRLKESSVDYENVSMEDGHGTIVETSPGSHFRKHQATKSQRDRKDESNRSNSSEKFTTSIDCGLTRSVSKFCTLPRRPRNTVSTFLTVVFEKGTGKKSLGFTIVGGRDSPKGSIGIFIKSVLPGGQAAEDGRLRAGDEILALNGHVCHDLTHREAVQLFRNIKSGPVALHLCRRVKNRETQVPKAKSCADLLLIDT
ncbi:uncharacterized protein LOC116846435 isoform X2 [Odontomachus brunneus]|uniref:uncharacterized protein LOC116846435 isoform X2 n=1 Tax=Odontomachus brunneus TaxID=486640 RepID=UPI0013F225C6|nr:uncharacterized protein LOC116846435 isoform X2 [Odontomachus brunneus]